MTGIEGLARMAGSWEGRNQLWMAPGQPVAESPTTATVVPSIRGKFLRMDYTWVEPGGEPQDSVLLVTANAADGTAEVHWVDSWHTGSQMMVLKGTSGQDGVLHVLGSYPAPSGPDWGWSFGLRAADPDTLRMTMHNIPPGSEPLLAVEAVYRRR